MCTLYILQWDVVVSPPHHGRRILFLLPFLLSLTGIDKGKKLWMSTGRTPLCLSLKKMQENLLRLIKVNEFNKLEGFKVVVEALVVENGIIYEHSWLGVILQISVELALLVFYHLSTLYSSDKQHFCSCYAIAFFSKKKNNNQVFL